MAPQFLGLAIFGCALLGTQANRAGGVNVATTDSKWEESLSSAVGKETVLFDIDPSHAMPEMSGVKAEGVARMELLASLTNRRWQQIKGVQVFSRGWTTGSPPPLRDTDRGLAWLKSLTPDLVTRMRDTGIPFGEVTESGRSFVSSLINNIQPGMASFMTDDPGNLVLSLDFVPKAVFTDSKIGKKVSIPLTAKNAGDISRMMPEFPKKPVIPAATQPLEPPPTGPLAFPKGRLVTLSDLCDQATSIFKERFIYDARLADSQVFIQGSFDKESFVEALRVVASTTPPEPIDGRTGVGEALRALMESNLSPLMVDPPFGSENDPKRRDLVSGQQKSGSDILKMFPGMEGILGANGMDRNSLVSLSFCIVVNVVAPGNSAIPGAAGTINGKTVPMLTRNAFGFQIGP